MKAFRLVTSAAISLICAQCGVVSAQSVPFLYLLSGTPGTEGKIPLDLIRVNAILPSSPVRVREVTQGSDCVLMSAMHRKLVVGSPAIAPKLFSVIDMDHPSRVASVQVAYDSNGLLPAGIYLLDMPGEGLRLGIALHQMWKKPFVYPTSLNAVAIEKGDDTESVELPLSALQYIRLDGRVGGGLRDDKYYPWVTGDPLRITLPGTPGFSSGIHRPPYLNGDSSKAVPLLVNNGAVAVIVGAPNNLDVLDKANGKWSRVSLPFRSYRVRAFDVWIGAIAEDLGLLAGVAGQEVDAREQQNRMSEFHEKNPGVEKRKTEVIATFGGRVPPMTVDDYFRGETAVYPGKLLVYNARTKVLATVSTGQADSEVLLINDEAVFYRVNDEVFRCPIIGGALGKPLLLASGLAIYQAHWAFLSAARE